MHGRSEHLLSTLCVCFHVKADFGVGLLASLHHLHQLLSTASRSNLCDKWVKNPVRPAFLPFSGNCPPAESICSPLLPLTQISLTLTAVSTPGQKFSLSQTSTLSHHIVLPYLGSFSSPHSMLPTASCLREVWVHNSLRSCGNRAHSLPSLVGRAAESGV